MYKRMLALGLAVLLLLSLTITAYAEETDESTAASETVTEGTEPSTQSETVAETEATLQTETQPEETQVPETTAPAATEPTFPTEATQPTQSSTQLPTYLEIDTKHIYFGMDEAYEDGYSPTVSGNTMYLVIPLRANGFLYHDEIKVSLGLGSSSSTPFVMANYEKVFELEWVKPKNSEIDQEIFLVKFDVALSGSRTNGVYPVTVNISGYDESGSTISAIYTIYVTIADGKSTTTTTTYTETATAEPVVYISNTVVEPENIMAGEEFAVTLTLKNSLTIKHVKNMLVKVDTSNVHINLLEDSNIFQIDRIDAGGETELTLRFSSDLALPAGKYPLSFSFSYDSSKTLNLSSSGTVMVEIHQPANMELVMPRFSDSITVGETIPLSLQVMNMGRDPMYNVRCVVSGYGFAPSNIGYIGTMTAGSSATTKVDLYVIALNASKGNGNGSQYGDTIGTVILIYEDENGTEFQQETTFSTTVNRPLVQIQQTDNTQEEQEQAASQWWVSILILGGVILAAVIGLVLGKKRQKKRSGAYL